MSAGGEGERNTGQLAGVNSTGCLSGCRKQGLAGSVAGGNRYWLAEWLEETGTGWFSCWRKQILAGSVTG